VQWIESTREGIPFRVRTTAEVHFSPDITSLQHTAIENIAGKWYASLYGYKRTFINNIPASEWTRFELGPPGQAIEVEVP
jgi:hypothetical protein